MDGYSIELDLVPSLVWADSGAAVSCDEGDKAISECGKVTGRLVRAREDNAVVVSVELNVHHP